MLSEKLSCTSTTHQLEVRLYAFLWPALRRPYFGLPGYAPTDVPLLCQDPSGLKNALGHTYFLAPPFFAVSPNPRHFISSPADYSAQSTSAGLCRAPGGTLGESGGQRL